MSPFAGYPSHTACVADNGGMASPHAFCAWLEHQVTGKWPAESQAEMPADAWAIFINPYAEYLEHSTSPKLEAEKEANAKGLEALKGAGWLFSRIGWVKQYAAPKMRTVAGVRVFATGTWVDSQGVSRDWTEAELDDLVKAFNAGYPGTVPIKAGHTPDSFNIKIAEKLGVPVELITGDIGGKGQVALGRMATLERRGNLLFGTFERVPDPIAELIEAGLFSTVSVEVETVEGGDYRSFITAVAMLGAEEPSVDEATLDRALVFGGKRDGAVVLSFQTTDLPIEVLEAEFNTLKGRMNESIKGMRGAPIFRAMMAQLGALFDQLKRNRSGHQSPGLKGGPNMDSVKGMSLKDIAAKYQIGPEELIALAASLGLGEGATIEDIIAAIEALKAKAGAAPPPTPEEAAKLAAEKLAAEQPAAFQKMTSELTKANETIRGLVHRELVTEWGKLTSTFQSIPGKTSELAEELAEIEETRGKDKANAHFERLESTNKAAFEANKVRGVALPGEKRADFEKEVVEYMKANEKATRGVATKAVMTANPTLYREYQAEERARQKAEES